MTAIGHIFFSISSLLCVYKVNIIPEFITGDWLYMLTGVVIGSLLPDIDHPSSYIGCKFRIFSIPLFKLCGHRGFTHSLFAWIFIILLISKIPSNYLISYNVFIQAFLLGYLSHIIGDMLTVKGVPFLWPLKISFRLPILNKNNILKFERYISIVLFLCAFFIPSDFFNSLTLIFNKINNIFKLFII